MSFYVTTLQLQKYAKLICTKCILIQTLHSNLKTYMNSQILLQTNPMRLLDLNDGIEHLTFHIIGQSHMVHFVGSLIDNHHLVMLEGFDQAIKVVKG
jgi:hypothetical protein